MAFESHTVCKNASDHLGMNQYIQATLQALLAAGLGALIAAAAGAPWCLFIVAEISAVMWLLGYYHWWLFGRLVCLGGDQSAVGMVVSNEPPSEKTGLDALDTDFSSNLLLPENPPGSNQATVETSSPFGFLIKEHADTKAEGLPFDGYNSTDKGSNVESAILHVEFEGAGIAHAMLGAQIALGLSSFALIACLAGGIWGAILAALLAFLAFLAALLGALFGLGDEGDPSDLGLGSIATNDSNGLGADVLGVMGRWVYDSGHANQGRGWNELHPLKMAEKLATWGGDWGSLTIQGRPVAIVDLIDKWKAEVGKAQSPLTHENQQEPWNRWVLHPEVDGCEEPDPIEPPR